MAELGLPFQNSLWYWVEATYGGGQSGTTLPISSKILDARLSVADKHKVLRGITSPTACNLLNQAEDLSFHLEYIPQAGDTMIDDVIDRGSGCILQTLAFYLAINQFVAGATDKTYLYIKGCVPKTVKISASHNTEYIVTIDYSVKSVVTTSLTNATGTVLSGAYLAFNTSSTGAITGNGLALAYITNSIDLNFNHNITDRWDHDSVTKDYAIAGAYDIDGSVDISLDGGGGNHLWAVLNQSEVTIVINMGTATGSPIITLWGCKWKTAELDVNISGENMMESAPFTAKPSSCSAIITAV